MVQQKLLACDVLQGPQRSNSQRQALGVQQQQQAHQKQPTQAVDHFDGQACSQRAAAPPGEVERIWYAQAYIVTLMMWRWAALKA
jgi:hypothetical protein